VPLPLLCREGRIPLARHHRGREGSVGEGVNPTMPPPLLNPVDPRIGGSARVEIENARGLELVLRQEKPLKCSLRLLRENAEASSSFTSLMEAQAARASEEGGLALVDFGHTGQIFFILDFACLNFAGNTRSPGMRVPATTSCARASSRWPSGRIQSGHAAARTASRP
jgi:hypothetical protein